MSNELSNHSGCRDVSTNDDDEADGVQVQIGAMVLDKSSAAFTLAQVELIHSQEETKEEVKTTGAVTMEQPQLDFQPSARRDDYRSSVGHSDGGFAL